MAERRRPGRRRSPISAPAMKPSAPADRRISMRRRDRAERDADVEAVTGSGRQRLVGAEQVGAGSPPSEIADRRDRAVDRLRDRQTNGVAARVARPDGVRRRDGLIDGRFVRPSCLLWRLDLTGADQPDCARKRVKNACGRGRRSGQRPAVGAVHDRRPLARDDPADPRRPARRPPRRRAAKVGRVGFGDGRQDLVVVAAGEHRRQAPPGRPRPAPSPAATAAPPPRRSSPPTPEASQIWARSPTRPSETSMALVAKRRSDRRQRHPRLRVQVAVEEMLDAPPRRRRSIVPRRTRRPSAASPIVPETKTTSPGRAPDAAHHLALRHAADRGDRDRQAARGAAGVAAEKRDAVALPGRAASPRAKSRDPGLGPVRPEARATGDSRRASRPWRRGRRD